MPILIFALLLVCYWPALHGGFLWDDQAHVTSPELRSLEGLRRIWFELGATQQYYPVLHTAFWLEHRLWGDATFPYHLCNLLFHTASCCLLALVLRRLINLGTRQDSEIKPVSLRYAGWLAAVIFAVHPVCVESVAWISEQKNTLSLVFYLLAGLAYFDYNATRKQWLYGKASLFFILALGTKSVTASLPAALLVVFWWKNGKLSWRDIRPLIPWFGLALMAGLFTAWIERKIIGAEGAAFDFTLAQRVLLAGRVIGFYASKLVWPVNLMFVYPHWEITAGGSYGFLLGAIGVTALLWILRRRTRGPLAAWLFFAGSLFPVLGFFNVYPFIFSYVADHFQYLPAMGLIAGTATGTIWLLAKAPPTIRASGWIIGVGLIALLAIQSNRQSRIYTDSETLYRQTIARNPNYWLGENNLAFFLANVPGRLPQALPHYERALQIRPDYAEAEVNLANALMTLPGRQSEALVHYEHALQSKPDFAEAAYNAANVLATQPDRIRDAVVYYHRALKIKPGFVAAHINLANLLATFPDQVPEALAHYKRALQLEPHSVEAHYNLAGVLAALPNRMPDAVAHYEEALRLKPDFAEAHLGLANALATMPGRLPEALLHYEEAGRIRPNFAEMHYGYANVLAQLPGRMSDALTHYLAALRINPDYAAAHNNLAVFYARKGQFEEAKKHWKRALELNPAYNDARRNLDILQQLQKR